MALMRRQADDELPIRDPDLVALLPKYGPEGRAMLELLQRGRDRNRAAQLVQPLARPITPDEDDEV
jgi:hypothetical protein